jgi:hypothetical protein
MYIKILSLQKTILKNKINKSVNKRKSPLFKSCFSRIKEIKRKDERVCVLDQ